MMPEIEVYYSKCDVKFSDTLYQKYLARLPKALQDKNKKYLRWQDRQAHLLGKLLLLKGLKNYDFDNDCLEKLKYSKYKRPFLEGNIDFNISHSNTYVVCVLGRQMRLGIDIEFISDISLEHYHNTMTDKEWEIILDSHNTKATFFKYWTIKESVLKAEGKGLSMPLHEIEVTQACVSLSNILWHVLPLDIDNTYACHLACNKEIVKVKKNHVNFM